MLINKSAEYSKGTVVAFKMVNGDEIIAEIMDNDMSGWTIKRPCTVLHSSQGIGLVQSLITGDINKNIDIRADHVMLHSPVIKEMESHYIQTTTGLQTITKGSIIK